MARKLVVELIADPKAYTAGLQSAAKQTKLFGAETEAMTARVGASMKGLGRSLAFATGGFVAFEGVTRFLEDSVNAARDAGVAQRSLGAQIKASGDSFTANQTAIQKAELSLEKYGFTSQDSAQALTVLERGTGNITRAISLQGLAADLARAKNLDLASAANVVAKVFGGQETALRRAVPGLDKNAHGLQLIADAQQRLAGQAKAGTTEAERFHAILHDTEVIVGTALLPTLNKFLESLGKWLQKMNESGKLQKDVNELVKTGTGIFQGVLDVVKPLVGAFKALGDAVGGTRNEVKLLLGVFLAFKATKMVSSLALIGTTASTSAGEVRGLRGALIGLTRIGLITIPIEILLNRGAIDKSVSGFLDRHGLGFLGGTNQVSKQVFDQFTGKPGGGIPGLQGPLGTPSGTGLGARGPVGAPSITGLPAGVSGIQNNALTAQQRAIGLAADPNNLALLRAQAAHDQAALAFAQKLRESGRISNAKYVSEVTAYASDLKQTNDTITSILQAAADSRKNAAADRKAAAQARTDAAQAAAQAAIDTRMGWLNFGIERAQATKTIKDDVKAYGALESFLKQRIRQEGRTLDLVQQLWEARQAVRDLNKKKAKAAGDPLAGLEQVSSKQLANILARGTGLDLAGRCRLGFNIAGAEIQPLHVHVNVDGREIGSVVTKQQARTSRRTAAQTSGRRG